LNEIRNGGSFPKNSSSNSKILPESILLALIFFALKGVTDNYFWRMESISPIAVFEVNFKDYLNTL